MVSKIQGFTRANGSTVNSVTIPKHIMEESGFKKQDEVEFQVDKNKNIVIRKVQ